jgi:LysR family glycine cleavage system transcriptional activator
LRFALVATDAGLDFTEANLDLAVCFDSGPGAHEGVAIGPRGFLVIGTAEGEAGAIGWPGHPGDGDGEIAALTVADAGLAIDAAALGLGRATVPAMLVAADIEAGRVQAFGKEDSDMGYWLIAPLPQWRQRKVKALVDALTV